MINTQRTLPIEFGGRVGITNGDVVRPIAPGRPIGYSTGSGDSTIVNAGGDVINRGIFHPGSATDPIAAKIVGSVHTMPVLKETEPTPPAGTSTSGGSTGGVAQGGATPTGGAALAGTGPLIDAIAALFGGGMQNPLDAVSSPSTAALEALQPTQAQTSSSSNPALVAVVLGAAAIAGVYLYAQHKKKHAAPAPAAK